MNEIAFQVNLQCTYTEALEQVTAALKSEGFGIMTEIDVKATLEKKIGADFRNYTILGACNPPLAHKALLAEPLVGLMLPCNVTVEATDDGVWINLVNPKAMLLTNPILADDPVMSEVANDAYERFSRVAETLSQS